MVIRDSIDNQNELKQTLEAYIKLNAKLKRENKELKQSTTVEIQSGSFTKKIYRKGKKKSERLIRFKKNPEKVTLGWIGNMEFLCYPHSSTDKIFVRINSSMIPLDKYDLPRLFDMHNKAKFVMEQGIDIIIGDNKSQTPIAKSLRLAYNAGYRREQNEIDSNFKRETDDLFEAMIEMKESVRRKWFNEDATLKKEFEKYLKASIKGKRKKKVKSDRKP